MVSRLPLLKVKTPIIITTTTTITEITRARERSAWRPAADGRCLLRL
jgi:hypothetical protein